MRAKARTILAIVRTDSTFERARVGATEAWVGRCLHCRTRLVVGLDGAPWSDATVEHILPRSHGGTDELPNLALACARCNHQKGVRHDARRPGDPKLTELVARLSAERMARWREPI